MNFPLRDRSRPFDDSCIYQGDVSQGSLYLHLLKVNKICCCDDVLYMYDDEAGMYRALKEGKEWLALSKFFSDDVCQTLNTSTVKEIVGRLKNTAEIQVESAQFNKFDNLINLRNCVYNYETGQLFQHSPEGYFTYCLNVRFDSKSSCPYFDKFCATSLAGEPEKRKLLLQIIGYLCSSLTAAKKAFILCGCPDSGKSQILKLIEYIVGKDNVSNIPLEKLGSRFNSAKLKDKLVNICGELSATPIRDIEVFKLLVGGDTIMGEFKGKSPFFFQNKCRLLYSGNMLPPVKNEDYSRAFINRLVVLNFPTEIPKSERERNLLKHLTEEADAIFFRAMAELKGLIDNNFSFVMLSDSENILSDYAFQSLNIDVFVEEQCEKGNNCRVHTVTLYEAYKKFCRENAVTPISRALFSQKIGSLIGVHNGRFRMNGNNPMRGFEGIGLKGSAPDMDTGGESEDKASVADEREGGEI